MVGIPFLSESIENENVHPSTNISILTFAFVVQHMRLKWNLSIEPAPSPPLPPPPPLLPTKANQNLMRNFAKQPVPVERKMCVRN